MFKEKVFKYFLLPIGIICIIFFLLISLISNFYNISKESASIVVGANYSFLIVKFGQYLRLIVSGFLHVSILHLCMNLYSLYNIVSALSFVSNIKKIWLVMLASIFISSLTSISLSNANILSLGLSGGIFGLFGYYLTYLFSIRDRFPSIQFFYRQIFIMFIPIIIISFLPQVDLFGHLGGLVTGVILYIVLNNNLYSKIIYIVTLLVITLMLFTKLITRTSITPVYIKNDLEVIETYSSLNKQLNINLFPNISIVELERTYKTNE